MKRAIYHLNKDDNCYDILDETSEGLLIEYIDDDNMTRLKLENKRQRKEWDDYGDSRE